MGLAAGGTDIRPILANPPSLAALSAAGHELRALDRVHGVAGQHAAVAAGPLRLTSAASQLYQRGDSVADKPAKANRGRRLKSRAFACVERAVRAGRSRSRRRAAPRVGNSRPSRLRRRPASISAGGWSDTPPFCLDWGGTVLNIAVTINGAYPIEVHLRRLHRLVCRCISEETGETAEFATPCRN